MFGRKKAARQAVQDDGALAPDEAAAEGVAPAGPLDVEDLASVEGYIDLGSLLIPPVEGLELRIPVDEQNEPLTVLLVTEDGVLEMRAFAAARGGDLWTSARADIARDTTERGGTVVEHDGPFGVELVAQVPVTGPEGEEFVQPTRVIGWTGGRWFLRATIAGRPVTDPEVAPLFEDALRAVAVRRGSGAMAPGEPLPLHLPPGAHEAAPGV